MTHLTEEQLLWHFYGETVDRAVPDHLETCAHCQAEYRDLQRVLKTVRAMEVPEPGLGYEQRLWRNLEARLPQPGVRKPWTRRWWILVPVAAALLVTAFLAGRISKETGNTSVAAGATKVRERILLVAVGDHLERSQMVLAELTNAPDGKGKIDISGERQQAEDLLEDNRLYRLTARNAGDTAMASVLDELERVLMEIANSPSTVSNDQLQQFRKAIEDRGLLFKVRVVGSQTRLREERNSRNSKDKKL